MAIAGDTIVVGAPWERSDGSGPSNNSAAAAGAVYVFGRNATVAPSGWSQQAYLKAPDTQPGDWFGASVAIDDSTIAVGASSDGTESYSTHPENAGAAYVLDRGSRLFLPNIVRP